MATTPLAQAFARVFNNGVGQVGLEVGTDPGLPVSDWIQIPRNMAKQTAFKVHADAMVKWASVAHIFNPGAPATGTVIADYPTAREAFGKYGWVGNSQAKVLVYGGRKYAKVGNDTIEIESVLQDAPTPDQVKAFYTVNRTATRPATLLGHEQQWINAVRFWSVVAGFVTAGKSEEYNIVDTPTEYAEGADDFAEFAVKFQAQSFTASAARAGNWRKANHATGGVIATGFADRWLRKEGFTADGASERDKNDVKKRITDAFYVATHASSVHAVLALLAPGDRGHWAEIDPTYGVMLQWGVMDSVRIRLEGPTQVAGAAIIADAMVTIKMLVREGLGPLLNHKDQVPVLVAKHAELEVLGVRGGIYAKWFMSGHPEGLTAEPFSQKGQGCDDLCGELGWVATKYYATNSIGKSPALMSAANQLGTPEAEGVWSSLASSKKVMSSGQIVAAYGVVKGSSATKDISDLSSRDPAKVESAVAAYNSISTDLAAQVGMAAVTRIDKDKVIAAIPGPSSPKGSTAAQGVASS